MEKISSRFIEFYDNIAVEMTSVEGYLAPWEIQFLALIGASPTANGTILEIGSFKGKSTIVLAKAARHANGGTVHAVDPMTSRSETDPDLDNGQSSLDSFKKNVAAFGVAGDIELHQMTSGELAKTWQEPLRLLWIDGDHTYEGAKKDFDGFRPHLANGAIVAIHDVLHEFEGSLRVFMEEILLSPNFGACGLVGSIGWARFQKNKKHSQAYLLEKLFLYKRLSRLLPYVAFGNKPTGLEKKVYKILRSRVPRKSLRPQEWIAKVKNSP